MPNSRNNDINNRPYRACVGVALFNKDGKVFVGERIDTPNAWQMPQGGIDPGEDIHAAAIRELSEEIGTDQVELIEMMEHTVTYDLPPHLLDTLWGGQYRGQEQYWVAMRFIGDNSDIDLEADERPEFSKWKWVDINDVLNLIVPFKLDVYKQVIKEFKKFTSPTNL